ncbi:MAG TPA: DUF305 domain-containing protein [Gemmatimonadaceae bacterium]|nr:DUF305 domain-containing protein [Gemmatimonadaceae bacterium]
MARVRERIDRTLAVIVAAFVFACGGAPSRQQETAPQPVTRAQSDFAAIAKARADSTRLPYTAADVHFMSGMIGHHAQAILISKWAPSHGAGESVLALTARIINAQQDEIALMQRWLRDRNQPVPEAKTGPMTMNMNGMEHEMLMPGMLTDDQLQQLDAAKGPEFDRLFLTFMIQHHRGAVSMVKDLFEAYGAGQDELVFKFASDVNVDQTTEIARMQKMLMTLVLGVPAP